MPSIRIGFSTDFNLTSEQVGIGTTRPTARLDVRGQVRSDNTSGSGGISTLTEYQGFLHSKQGIGNTVSISQTTKGNLNSLSGELVISSEVTVSAGTSIGAGRLDSLTVTSSFDLPRGGSANREVAPEKGSTRFNQDLGQLEFYTGYEWRTVGSIDGSGRGRGVWAGGYNVSASPSTATAGISYIQISTLGNSVNFGSLTTAGQDAWGCSSSTRGLFGGRFNGNAIEYITIASEGNSIDFGDLAQTTGGINYAGALSSSTRGIWAGGAAAAPISADVNIIQYVTIATIGNTLDFGDLTKTATPNGSGLSSPTRGLFAVSSTSGDSSLINAITTASTGNAVEFGNLTTRNGYTNAPGFSNSIRGVWGSRSSGGITNTIDYVTISTFGNAVDFGDSTTSGHGGGAVASSIRGVFCVGQNPSLSGSERDQNVLNYITIATTGNAIDFGDLTRGGNSYSRHTGPVSDSHGGLGGF